MRHSTLTGLAAFAFAVLCSHSSAGAQTTFTNSAAISIPSNGTERRATPYPSTITVSGIGAPILDVSVTLNNFTHTFVNDVSVLLVSPAGEKIVLMAGAGSGSINNANLTFVTNGAMPLPPTGNLTSGSYLPAVYRIATFVSPAPAGPYATSLQSVIDTQANGTWSLYVLDGVPGFDGGSVAGGWSLTIRAPSSTSAVSTTLTYQGRLTDAAGQPFNGPVNLRFSLWTTPTADNVASRIAGPTTINGVNAVDGLITVPVDLGTLIEFAAALWLRIEVELPGSGSGFVALSPLQPITITPKAARALIADRASSATNLVPTANQFLNDRGLFLRGPGDLNHGLRYIGAGGFAGSGLLDGPGLSGFQGGLLGTTAGGERAALVWNALGNVGIGQINPTARLHLGGTPGTDGLRFPDGTLQTSAFLGRLRASQNINVAPIPPFDETTVFVAVPGATIGDVVHVSPRSPLPFRLVIGQANVSSPGTISFTIVNAFNITVDPASTIFDVVVLK